MEPHQIILSIGGASQIAAIFAAIYEVGVAYAKFQGEPVRHVFSRRARQRWGRLSQAARNLLRPNKEHQRVFTETLTITGAAEASVSSDFADARGTVTPAGELDAIRQRLEDLEQSQKQLASQVEELEADAASNRDAVDDLTDGLAALGQRLDQVVERLEGLIAAAEAGHGPVRLFIAVALTLGVAFVTWPQGVAAHFFWPAVAAGVATASLGVYAFVDLWRRRDEDPTAVDTTNA